VNSPPVGAPLPFRLSRREWCRAALAAVLPLSGCATVPVSVSNPIPGLTTVAVAPFFNLSSEPTADGRRFAQAYYAELQKQAGFQVIPVGVVEEAISTNGLSLEDPADTVELCRLLGADAVVIGGITDYRPYYPPQVGLQVQWYSPRGWLFYPGPIARPGQPPPAGAAPFCPPQVCPPQVVRGQSDEEDLSNAEVDALVTAGVLPVQLVQGGASPKGGPVAPPLWPQRDRGRKATSGTAVASSEESSRPATGSTGGSIGARAGTRARPSSQSGGMRSEDLSAPAQRPTEPLMSYTRFFDGADPVLVKSLKAYVAHRGDLRSGGWEGYLQRSEDFLQFTSHLMILEMLQLHGGQLKSETVWPTWK
jgi:hypothetical protein